jgi:sporulation protein YlmC with PRC-barrel domain
MSLQTGTRWAHTAKPILDPANLRIVAYEVEGPLLAENPSFMRTADIREYGRLGMIIDSNDELIGLDDVIHIKQLVELKFPLIGLQVIDDQKRKLGKVDDYTLDTGDFLIQQINVRRGLIKGITDTGFLVNRSQIIEINNNAIIVKSPSVKSVEPVMQAIRGEFVNPFRNHKPQAKPETITKSN